ncbi:MAG: hypothetical protein HDQ91_07410 [Desulfovibrio sp.]|nr:hypothetical protein [Desulfovibrio sp.]
MPDQFLLDCQWLDIEPDNAEERLLCHLRIMAGDRCLTSNARDGEQRDSILVSAYPLAAWLVDKYWRLAYETGGETRPLDWLVSHDLSAADSGYIWPPLRLISNDIGIHICFLPQEDQPGPRYSSPQSAGSVHIGAFRQGVMNFLRDARGRIASSWPADPLSQGVEQLEAELANEELTTWRMLEAALGYDPDGAPDAVMEAITELAQLRGLEFCLEAASVYNVCATGSDPLSSLSALAEAANRVTEHGIDALFQPGIEPGANWRALVPWQAGYKLAQAIRQLTGLAPARKLATSVLRDWFRLPEISFLEGATLPMGALCRKTASALRFLFPETSRSFLRVTRRFFLARMAGACFYEGEKDSWLAFNDGGVWSQKMQRAFAAELLAPIAGIRELVGSRINTINLDEIQRISDHYEASPITICHTLRNNRDISYEKAAALMAALAS